MEDFNLEDFKKEVAKKIREGKGLTGKEGGTELELSIDYTVPIPVLGKVAERIILKRNDREAELAVENIKLILEE